MAENHRLDAGQGRTNDSSQRQPAKSPVKEGYGKRRHELESGDGRLESCILRRARNRDEAKGKGVASTWVPAGQVMASTRLPAKHWPAMEAMERLVNARLTPSDASIRGHGRTCQSSEDRGLSPPVAGGVQPRQMGARVPASALYSKYKLVIEKKRRGDYGHGLASLVELVLSLAWDMQCFFLDEKINGGRQDWGGWGSVLQGHNAHAAETSNPKPDTTNSTSRPARPREDILSVKNHVGPGKARIRTARESRSGNCGELAGGEGKEEKYMYGQAIQELRHSMAWYGYGYGYGVGFGLSWGVRGITSARGEAVGRLGNGPVADERASMQPVGPAGWIVAGVWKHGSWACVVDAMDVEEGLMLRWVDCIGYHGCEGYETGCDAMRNAMRCEMRCVVTGASVKSSKMIRSINVVTYYAPLRASVKTAPFRDSSDYREMAMDALKNITNNIPDWLKRLDDLSGQIDQRQAELAAVAAAEGRSPETKSLRNKGSTESLKPNDDGPSPFSQPAELLATDTNDIIPEDAPLPPPVTHPLTPPAGAQRPPASPPSPSAIKQSREAIMAARTRVRAQAKKRHRSSSFVSAEGAPPSYRTRSMIIVYYDSYVQSFFDDLVRFVSSSRNLMRKAKMAAKVAQIKRTAFTAIYEHKKIWPHVITVTARDERPTAGCI
ncbi:hypothetical protein G7046_g6946 [Stylonectria norvegica]|nr:hypothetical protein G7046_g6946 [Stylonectria norvegica]